MDVFQPAANVDYEELLTWADVGDTLLNRQLYHEAVTVLNEAVRRRPTDGQSWFALGQAYFNIGKLTEARAALCLARFNDGPPSRIRFYLERVRDVEESTGA